MKRQAAGAVESRWTKLIAYAVIASALVFALRAGCLDDRDLVHGAAADSQLSADGKCAII